MTLTSFLDEVIANERSVGFYLILFGLISEKCDQTTHEMAHFPTTRANKAAVISRALAKRFVVRTPAGICSACAVGNKLFPNMDLPEE